jgi:hypothetical protein
MIDGTIAASTDDTTTVTDDTTDGIALPATGEITGEDQPVTTDSTDGDDEDEVKSSDSDGKLDAVKVNEIVKRRVEKVRNKTREEVQKAADEEIEFWKEKAKGQKTNTVLITLPPKPKLMDYASNPPQYEKDLENWSKLKTDSETYTAGVHAQYGARAQEFAKDKPDYQKSVNFFNSVTVEPALMTSILESEQGPALSYYLSKNFKEFDRINKLSPVSVAREIGKLELKLTGKLKDDPVVDNKTKVVPKPTAPVSGKAPTSQSMESLRKNDVNKFIAERKRLHREGAISRSK